MAGEAVTLWIVYEDGPGAAECRSIEARRTLEQYHFSRSELTNWRTRCSIADADRRFSATRADALDRFARRVAVRRQNATEMLERCDDDDRWLDAERAASG